MNTKFWHICLISYGLLGLVGCNDIPSEYQPFFQLSRSKQETAILNYPLDQQIDLMILGWTGPRPPINLHYRVAKNGEPVVPLLIQRFSKINDMYTLRTIVLCLSAVNRRYFEWTTIPKYVEMSKQAMEEKDDPEVEREVRAILETGDPHPFFKDLKHGKRVDKGN